MSNSNKKLLILADAALMHAAKSQRRRDGEVVNFDYNTIPDQIARILDLEDGLNRENSILFALQSGDSERFQDSVKDTWNLKMTSYHMCSTAYPGRRCLTNVITMYLIENREKIQEEDPTIAIVSNDLALFPAISRCLEKQEVGIFWHEAFTSQMITVCTKMDIQTAQINIDRNAASMKIDTSFDL